MPHRTTYITKSKIKFELNSHLWSFVVNPNSHIEQQNVDIEKKLENWNFFFAMLKDSKFLWALRTANFDGILINGKMIFFTKLKQNCGTRVSISMSYQYLSLRCHEIEFFPISNSSRGNFSNDRISFYFKFKLSKWRIFPGDEVVCHRSFGWLRNIFLPKREKTWHSIDDTKSDFLNQQHFIFTFFFIPSSHGN